MTRRFVGASQLFQHLSALRTLARECPAEYAAIVRRHRWLRSHK